MNTDNDLKINDSSNLFNSEQNRLSIKNEFGFSIAEVIVALGIMGVLSLGLTTMIQNQSRSIFLLEDQLSHQSLKIELERLFKNNDICTQSLNGIKIPTALIEPESMDGNDFVIKNSTGGLLYKADTAYDRLSIKSIKVQNLDITDPTLGSGFVNIKIDVQRLRGINTDLRSINIKQVVNIDPVTMNAIECTGLNEDEGSASCYRYISSQQVGVSGGPSTITIPKGVKMASVSLPMLDAGGGSEGTPCHVPGNTLYFEIGGSSPYKAGQILRVTSANSARGDSKNDSGLYVGSHRISTFGHASNHDCYPRVFFSANQIMNPSMCIKKGENPSNHNVVFWK